MLPRLLAGFESVSLQSAECRAAKRVREIARRFGTPIYDIKDGRIVAEKP